MKMIGYLEVFYLVFIIVFKFFFDGLLSDAFVGGYRDDDFRRFFF